MIAQTIPKKPIAEDDETRLWKTYWRATRTERSRVHGELVELYLPLVARAVERMSIRVRDKVQKEELLSAGVLGLHDAVSNFTCTKGGSFRAFARKRIHGAIIDELRNQDHLTRCQRQNYREICATIKTLSERFFRSPTIPEIAEELGKSERDVAMYIGMGSSSVKLNDEFKDGLTYMDLLADHKAVDPADAADRSIAMAEMREAFRGLDERDQKLLFLRHHEGLKVKEIAVVLGISEGRISQLYKEIVTKLRILMKVHIGS